MVITFCITILSEESYMPLYFAKHARVRRGLQTPYRGT